MLHRHEFGRVAVWATVRYLLSLPAPSAPDPTAPAKPARKAR